MSARRIVVENLRPATPTGSFAAKATIGRAAQISADIFREGHDVLAGRALWKGPGDRRWRSSGMVPLGNDRWLTHIIPEELGPHRFKVEAWTDTFATWRHDTVIKLEANQPVRLELEEGRLILEEHSKGARGEAREVLREAAERLGDANRPTKERLSAALAEDVAQAVAAKPVKRDATVSVTKEMWVDRERAHSGAWYELFPRSYGGFKGTITELPRVAQMGFDILYLPPIHPIGHTHRKGANNTLEADESDPGSPWAIGSKEGGHTAIHPDLGGLDDFKQLLAEAEAHGLEVALDYALQCSPDHPWVEQHPEWFHHRPDGSIRYAENPPKRYQDIYPINFWPEGGPEPLWEACKEILDHWMDQGVSIFRVDNPHTKPTAFWEWLIPQLRERDPGVILLSEAFTRPKVMSKLAEVGFTQSYTYFTWRTTKSELTEYLSELAHTEKADYFRPNFWPNTPDILSGPLRHGGPGAFKMRLVLAATMTPSYGVYSGYELCENEPASEDNEEYLNSEKYEIRRRDFTDPDSLGGFIGRVNQIRRDHPALQELRTISFHPTSNDQVIAYSKHTEDRHDVMLMVVNLDTQAPQTTDITLDLPLIGMPTDEPFEVRELLSGAETTWKGREQRVTLEPGEPAAIYHLRSS